MNKVLLAVAAISTLVLLAGCSGDPSPEERAYVNAILPEGCKLYEAGSFGSIKRLVFVQCSAATATSTNIQWTVSHGKTTSREQAVAIVVEPNA